MRCFAVPWVIAELGIKGKMLSVLIALIYLEDKYRGSCFERKEGKWFNASNKELRRIAGVSEDTLIKYRNWMSDNGYIEFVRGHSGVNTKYRINIGVFNGASRFFAIPENIATTINK
jgi:hypothetical protein